MFHIKFIATGTATGVGIVTSVATGTAIGATNGTKEMALQT
jgi:hypothetical protein